MSFEKIAVKYETTKTFEHALAEGWIHLCSQIQHDKPDFGFKSIKFGDAIAIKNQRYSHILTNRAFNFGSDDLGLLEELLAWYREDKDVFFMETNPCTFKPELAQAITKQGGVHYYSTLLFDSIVLSK